jgi:predicted nucleic acid-binding protein
MYLLDTNVLSELKKIPSGRANANVFAWASRTSLQDHFISAISLFEITRGVLLVERRDPAQAAALRTWMEREVLNHFADRILPVTSGVALRSAELHVPNPRPERDTFIAATALSANLVLVTRNVSDFQDTGVHLLNPWQER